MSDRYEEMVMERTNSGRFLRWRETKRRMVEVLIKILGIATIVGSSWYFLSKLPVMLVP